MINRQACYGKIEDLLVSCFFFVWFVYLVVRFLESWNHEPHEPHEKETRNKKILYLSIAGLAVYHSGPDQLCAESGPDPKTIV